MRRINWLQIDIPVCGLKFADTNSEGTCNSTALTPCFNSLATCSSLPDYEAKTAKAFFTDSTLDLDMPTGDLYAGAIPIANIQSVDVTPPRIALGEGLGARSTLRVTFTDHPTSDLQSYEDPYTTERNYNPFKQGTFWGKFMARHKFLRGQVVRWAVVDPQQISFDEFPADAQIFIIDRFEMSNGTVALIAKDPASLLDDKRAIAPRLSRGQLSANLNTSATSITLVPEGIGNAEYPASGFVAIGGVEVCAFARSGDVLTLIRGQYNTEAVEHDADDRVQLCIEYDGDDPADIIYDLMIRGGIPASYINLADWKSRTNAPGTGLIQRTYGSLLAEPAPIKSLLVEIMEQSGIFVWWNGNTFRLDVLRNLAPQSLYNDDLIQADTITIREQPEKRVSQVWVYFGQINPLESQTDPKNYQAALVTAQATVADLESKFNNVSSVKTIFSRWITRLNRAAAERINTLILSRYAIPPKMVGFTLLNTQSSPSLAQAVTIDTYYNQSAQGSNQPLPCQVIEIKPSASRSAIMAEEITFTSIADPDDPTVKIIPIDGEVTNIDFRTEYDKLFPEPSEDDTVILKVNAGGVIGSTSTTLPALTVQNWYATPTTLKIAIDPGGFIVGRGGQGGNASGTFTPGRIENYDVSASNGQAGGLALLALETIEIENNGIIGGGGGGGAGGASCGGGSIFPASAAISGGGAGAGYIFSNGGTATSNNNNNSARKPGGNTINYNEPGLSSLATISLSGVQFSSRGGNGATLGVAGGNTITAVGDKTATALGGAAGTAIDGFSLCTITGTGSVLGPTIN